MDPVVLSGRTLPLIVSFFLICIFLSNLRTSATHFKQTTDSNKSKAHVFNLQVFVRDNLRKYSFRVVNCFTEFVVREMRTFCQIEKSKKTKYDLSRNSQCLSVCCWANFVYHILVESTLLSIAGTNIICRNFSKEKFFIFRWAFPLQVNCTLQSNEKKSLYRVTENGELWTVRDDHTTKGELALGKARNSLYQLSAMFCHEFDISHSLHSLAHNWRDTTLPFPSPPLTPLFNGPAQKIKQTFTSCSSVSQFVPLSWSPYVVRFVHSLFRASRAISRHQNSFRAQPPSQVLGQWRTANENREEQQCWGENQQRLKKQEMTTILTETSLFARLFAVCFFLCLRRNF